MQKKQMVGDGYIGFHIVKEHCCPWHISREREREEIGYAHSTILVNKQGETQFI